MEINLYIVEALVKQRLDEARAVNALPALLANDTPGLGARAIAWCRAFLRRHLPVTIATPTSQSSIGDEAAEARSGYELAVGDGRAEAARSVCRGARRTGTDQAAA